MLKKNSMLAVALAASVVTLGSVVSVANASDMSNNPIIAANDVMGIGYVGTQNNYSEDVPSPADTENGLVNGVKLNASANFNGFGVKHWYLGSSYTYSSGNVTYREGGVVSEKSKHTENVINLKFGKSFFMVDNRLAITPYLFGGYRWWHRDVPGGVAAPENYHNGYIGVGSMVQYAATNRLVLTASSGIGEVIGAGVSGTINPEIASEYDFPSNMSFSLSSRPYYTLGWGANYRVNRHMSIYGELNYTDFMYGASKKVANIDDTVALNEPSSQTSQFAFGVGLDYDF